MTTGLPSRLVYRCALLYSAPLLRLTRGGRLDRLHRQFAPVERSCVGLCTTRLALHLHRVPCPPQIERLKATQHEDGVAKEMEAPLPTVAQLLSLVQSLVPSHPSPPDHSRAWRVSFCGRRPQSRLLGPSKCRVQSRTLHQGWMPPFSPIFLCNLSLRLPTKKTKK